MMNGYLSYAVTDVFCVLYAVSTLLHLNASMGSEHEVNKLRNMILYYIVFVISEILWALYDGGLFWMPQLLYLIVNAISIGSLTLGCYSWMIFVEARIHPNRVYTRQQECLIFSPVILVAVLDIASVFTGWMFTLDQNGFYISTDLFLLQSIVNFSYLLIPTAEFVLLAFRTPDKEMRREYVTYAIYMTVPLACGFLEDALPLTPILELSIFLMIHIFFITIQNLQICNDALTGLNNRQRLWSYLRELLPEATERKPFYLSMIDIDFFKSVNDQYGHVEGDAALKTVARAIMHVAGEYRAFAARYGGDEFCIVSQGEPDQLRVAIDDAIASEAEALPCQIRISMGWAKCCGKDADPDAIVIRADEKLYEEKKLKHAGQQ